MQGSHWWRDPVLGFVMAGVILAIAYRLLGGNGDGTTIHVSEADLLTFVQFRERQFDGAAAKRHLDNLDAAARRRLIDDYVREEALVREARALGLDRSDFVIRQRLVQKMEFLTGDAETVELPDDAVLEAWYDANAERYRRAPTVTFAHVFIDDVDETAAKRAKQLVATLNEEPTAFGSAASYGERFPYHAIYVDRSLAEVESHFGESFRAALESLDVTESPPWQGPLPSRHGLHLVRLRARTKAHLPAFDDVRDAVAYDYRRDELHRRRDSLANDVVARYRIKLAPGLDDD